MFFYSLQYWADLCMMRSERVCGILLLVCWPSSSAVSISLLFLFSSSVEFLYTCSCTTTDTGGRCSEIDCMDLVVGHRSCLLHQYLCPFSGAI